MDLNVLMPKANNFITKLEPEEFYNIYLHHPFLTLQVEVPSAPVTGRFHPIFLINLAALLYVFLKLSSHKGQRKARPVSGIITGTIILVRTDSHLISDLSWICTDHVFLKYPFLWTSQYTY